MIACKDCKHVLEVTDSDGHLTLAKCRHPKAYRDMPDYYDGKLRIIAVSVDTMRTLGECGPDATLFKPKGFRIL